MFTLLEVALIILASFCVFLFIQALILTPLVKFLSRSTWQQSLSAVSEILVFGHLWISASQLLVNIIYLGAWLRSDTLEITYLLANLSWFIGGWTLMECSVLRHKNSVLAADKMLASLIVANLILALALYVLLILLGRILVLAVST